VSGKLLASIHGKLRGLKPARKRKTKEVADHEGLVTTDNLFTSVLLNHLR
jgi:hypothetical protein